MFFIALEKCENLNAYQCSWVNKSYYTQSVDNNVGIKRIRQVFIY